MSHEADFEHKLERGSWDHIGKRAFYYTVDCVRVCVSPNLIIDSQLKAKKDN